MAIKVGIATKRTQLVQNAEKGADTRRTRLHIGIDQIIAIAIVANQGIGMGASGRDDGGRSAPHAI